MFCRKSEECCNLACFFVLFFFAFYDYLWGYMVLFGTFMAPLGCYTVLWRNHFCRNVNWIYLGRVIDKKKSAKIIHFPQQIFFRDLVTKLFSFHDKSVQAIFFFKNIGLGYIVTYDFKLWYNSWEFLANFCMLTYSVEGGFW